MSILPEPNVIVKPFSRLDPTAKALITNIKNRINEESFMTAAEFKQHMEPTPFLPENILTHLEEEGITYITTAIAENDGRTQEVLVDIRQMAAAMLLIYSDTNFAKKNSVLKYLRALFIGAGWQSAFQLMLNDPLLDDMYAQHGHNFTWMKIAESADLSGEDVQLIEKRAARFMNPLRELIKSDAELTAVFQLCKRVMDVTNDVMINGHLATRKDVEFRHFSNPIAYNGFWVAAQKVLDQHAKAVKKSLH